MPYQWNVIFLKKIYDRVERRIVDHYKLSGTVFKRHSYILPNFHCNGAFLHFRFYMIDSGSLPTLTVEITHRKCCGIFNPLWKRFDLFIGNIFLLFHRDAEWPVINNVE